MTRAAAKIARINGKGEMELEVRVVTVGIAMGRRHDVGSKITAGRRRSAVSAVTAGWRTKGVGRMNNNAT